MIPGRSMGSAVHDELCAGFRDFQGQCSKVEAGRFSFNTHELSSIFCGAGELTEPVQTDKTVFYFSGLAVPADSADQFRLIPDFGFDERPGDFKCFSAFWETVT